MYRRSLSLIVAILTSQLLFAQFSISGTIRDQQAKTILSGATVRLNSFSDSSFSRSALTDSLGRFSFTDLVSDSFLLSISYVGYKETVRSVKLDSASLRLDSLHPNTVTVDIALAQGSAKGDLATVVITSSITPVTQKADTLQMNASQYKVNPDATTEDLVKKMPGITIENGQVKAQGDVVQKVTIDGRELFGDDATAALRNLPAEVVDKIQVFDRLSDQARFSGFDDGSSQKGINIITKANMRNGQFGRVFAGYGTDERYLAGGNTTILKDNKRISIVGNFNNVNQQNFSQQDLLGVTSNSQRGGGGGGPRGGRGGGQGGNRGQGGGFQGGGSNGAFGNSGNFLVGQQSGINKTNAFGLNYSDIWGKKLTVTGSYFFNNTANTTSETSNQQYFLSSIPSISQVTNSTSKNTNNRVNLRLEYKIDSNNQLIITPNLSFQNNSSTRLVTTNSFFPNGQNVSATTNNTTSDRVGNNLNNTILYRHSFAKRGRTIALNINTSSNTRDGNTYVNSNQRQYDTTGNSFTDSLTRRYTDQTSSGYQLSANLSYTEPLGAKSQLQLSYNPSYSNSKSDQQAFRYNNTESKYSVFDTSLSNRFTNISKAQNGGLAYRYGDRDNQISFGANYQYSTLGSDQAFPKTLTVNKSFSNVLPNANVQLKLSTRSSLRINYRANTNNPSVSQLSDVFDITNLPYITAGNPNLKQQFSNQVNGRYTYTNTSKGLVLVGSIFYQNASDYITNATYVPTRDSIITSKLTVLRGQQLSIPVNLDGYQSLRSFVTFAIPVKAVKSNFNLNGGITYTKLPGIINNVSNESKNTTYTAGAVIGSNISQYVDFTISYSANFSKVKNNLQASLDDSYFQHVLGLQMNLLSKTGWFFQNDITNQLYNGLTQGFNQNYTLWNMSAGKKFLKNQKGELKLTVFDLLKQNQSITRNVTSEGIEDVQTQVLRQYVMLNFTYNLRTFGTVVANNNRGGGEGRNYGPPRF